MQTRTAAFDATVREAHQIAVQVNVLLNRTPVLTNLRVTDGNVTLDRTAAIRGRCSVTFAEPLLIPTSSGGPLTPYGYEIAIARGVTYTDGTRELIPLGVFPIQTSTLDGVTLVTSIAANDRAQLVVDARLEDAYTIPAGTNYATAIRDLIAAGVPGLTYNLLTTSYTTPALVFEAQADRWDAARNMATSIGAELYFDGGGTCVLRPEPGFGAVPVWSISEGEGGLLVAAALALDRAPAYNRVVATGENTSLGAVPRGVWTDTDPVSPTNYNGPFGHKPRFYASAFITTDAQAVSAATSIGQSQQGVARSLAFGSVPNPALEPGDCVEFIRTAIGINECHSIDSLTFGLAADGEMTGSSRWGSTS